MVTVTVALWHYCYAWCYGYSNIDITADVCDVMITMTMRTLWHHCSVWCHGDIKLLSNEYTIVTKQWEPPSPF